MNLIPDNIIQSSLEFCGRKLEMHELLKCLKDPAIKAINLWGESGDVKTMFVKELAKFLTVHRES